MFERPFMCLWPYNGISLSFSSIWFKSFGPGGNSWKEYFAQVCSCGSARSLAWFKPTFGVERASQGFFSRCDFETFQIKPVDPLIACVAWGFFFLITLFFFFFFRVWWKPKTSVGGLEEPRIFRPGPLRPLVHSSRWKRHRRIERRKTILLQKLL